jgi:hypothetical protein
LVTVTPNGIEEHKQGTAAVRQGGRRGGCVRACVLCVCVRPGIGAGMVQPGMGAGGLASRCNRCPPPRSTAATAVSTAPTVQVLDSEVDPDEELAIPAMAPVLAGKDLLTAPSIRWEGGGGRGRGQGEGACVWTCVRDKRGRACVWICMMSGRGRYGKGREGREGARCILLGAGLPGMIDPSNG